jgi:branched-chain amino acid transport system substrate-binding protein
MTRSRTVNPLLFSAAIALAVGVAAPAQADELRIGFIAPMTGSFSQVGKDMVNGFQMYLDEHKGKNAFGGATVKFTGILQMNPKRK